MMSGAVIVADMLKQQKVATTDLHINFAPIAVQEWTVIAMTEKERLMNLIYKVGDLAHKWPTDNFTSKLADYLLDNGIVMSPVKLGDKVYFICEEFDEYGGDYIAELTVTEVSNVRFWVQNEDENHFRYTDIGKTVFLTEVEAQSVLKRKEKIGVDTDKCGLRRHHAPIS